MGIGGKEVIGKERPNAKFVKDLEDTGDLDGMLVSCFSPKYHTNEGNQRNLPRHTGSRKGLEKELMTSGILITVPPQHGNGKH